MPGAGAFLDSTEDTTIAFGGHVEPQWPHLIQYSGLTATIFLCRSSNTFAGQTVRQRPHLVHLRWMTRGGTELGDVLLLGRDTGLAVMGLAPCREMASGVVDDKSGKTIAESRSTSNSDRGFLLFTMQNGNEWYDVQHETTPSEGG